MTFQEYQKNYSDQLKTFLDTPAGQNFLSVLGAHRPAYEFSVQNHLLTENRGAMRGYELCMRNAVLLSKPYAVHHDIEPTYGVPNKPSNS